MSILLIVVLYLLCCLGSLIIYSKAWLLKFGKISVGDFIFFFIMSLFGPISLISSSLIELTEWVYHKNYNFLNKTLFKKNEKHIF